jgi:hypothetical protein
MGGSTITGGLRGEAWSICTHLPDSLYLPFMHNLGAIMCTLKVVTTCINSLGALQ